MGYAMQQEEFAPANAPQSGYIHAERLREYLEINRAKGISQKEVARRIEYSPTVISLYLARNYNKGDLAQLDDKIGKYLDAEKAYETFRPNIRDLADTSQVQDVIGTIHYVQQNKLFGLIVGEAGIGKTAAFREFARQNLAAALLLTLDPLKRSKSAFVQYFWAQIPGNRHRNMSASKMMDEIVEYFTAKHKTVIVDEAQFLSMDALEMARSIQDKTGIGFVLGGTFNLDREFGLNGHQIINEQLHSRVLIYTRLNPQIKKADLAKVCAVYGIADPAIAEWFYARCNRVGRRYRWICALLKAAYGLSVEQGVPLTVDVIEQAEGVTGLY